MAKTLQSAVQTLERDKAQLQGRVHSLEQRLMGTTASEDAAGAPSSGEEAAVRRQQNSVIILVNLFFPPTSARRRRRSGAAEGREGVRRGPSKSGTNQAGSGGGSALTRVPVLSPDQLPQQRHRGPAAEERGAEDQTEEARPGRVQRQRRRRRVRRHSSIFSAFAT